MRVSPRYYGYSIRDGGSRPPRMAYCYRNNISDCSVSGLRLPLLYFCTGTWHQAFVRLLTPLLLPLRNVHNDSCDFVLHCKLMVQELEYYFNKSTSSQLCDQLCNVAGAAISTSYRHVIFRAKLGLYRNTFLLPFFPVGYFVILL